MYCKKCGKEVSSEEKFCSNCGESVNNIEKNNGKNNIVVVIGLVVILIVVIGLIIGEVVTYNNGESNAFDDNETTVTEEDNNNSDELVNVEIKNSEIKELFDSVGGNMSINDIQATPIKNGNLSEYSDNSKLSLLGEFALEDKKKELTSEIMSKVSSKDQSAIKDLEPQGYISKNDLVDVYKKVYNEDLTVIPDHIDSCPVYVYIKSLDGYVISGNCGGSYGPLEIINTIYDYKENNGTISVYVVYAYHNTDNNTYLKYENGNEIEVEKNDNFEFTKDNINKYNRVEYQFKKNNEGKYYVYDIINI